MKKKPITLSAALIAVCAFCLAGSNRLVSAAELAPGLAKEKPAEGPSIKVDKNLYMVPYDFRVPGTEQVVEMIPVPGGEFMIGSPETEADRQEDEGPQVRVTVDPMWVAKTEVNWALYKEFMALYGIFKEFESSGKRSVTDANKVDAITAPTELYEPTFTYEYGEEDSHPAVTMTQYSAQQFTKWLSLVSGQQYRLPTEAEWEFLSRPKSKEPPSIFPWGSEYPPPQKTGNFADKSNSNKMVKKLKDYDDSFAVASPVGSFQKSMNDLYDMGGNTAEWVHDFYEAEPPTVTSYNYLGPSNGKSRTVKGSSWMSSSYEELKSSYRTYSDARRADLGFRIARYAR